MAVGVEVAGDGGISGAANVIGGDVVPVGAVAVAR